MTLKMIISTEHHLKDLGIQCQWLDHRDYGMYDTHTLYQSNKVCVTCFSLYKQVLELNKVEKKFSKAMGVP